MVHGLMKMVFPWAIKFIQEAAILIICLFPALFVFRLKYNAGKKGCLKSKVYSVISEKISMTD